MDETAIYTSHCAAKNLWQRYEVFPNRLELHSHLGNFVIPFDQVEQVELYPPVINSLRLHIKKGGWPFRFLKMDLADLAEHVVVDKNTGVMRHVMFTPDNPTEFKQVLQQALQKFRAEMGEGKGPK